MMAIVTRSSMSVKAALVEDDCRIIDRCITNQTSSARRVARKMMSTDKEPRTRSHEVVIVILNETKIQTQQDSRLSS